MDNYYYSTSSNYKLKQTHSGVSTSVLIKKSVCERICKGILLKKGHWKACWWTFSGQSLTSGEQGTPRVRVAIESINFVVQFLEPIQSLKYGMNV